MKRILLPLCLCAMFMAASAYAIPARLPYMPPAAPKAPSPPPPVDLRETTWKGTVAAESLITFHADGTLSYNSARRGGGTWRLEGNVVYFEINNRYREFRGTLQGNNIHGESWNIAGKRWATHLQRTTP